MLLVPINITGISGKTTVLEGDDLLLICEASSRLKPNINWTKEKAVVVQEGKVLNITNINRTYAGEYNCSADNGFGKPEIRTVYVNVTCEYVLKKTLTIVKERCTFHLFFVLLCAMLSITFIDVWLGTSMEGSKLNFSKNPSIVKGCYKTNKNSH